MERLLQWRSNKYYIFWVYVCSFRCTACNTHTPFVMSPAQLYSMFSTLSHKRHEFRKKSYWPKTCVFSANLSETFLILTRHERNMIIIFIGLHVRCLLFLSAFNDIWIFSKKVWTILKYQISFKSVQWQPSCSLRTDRHDGANSRFSQFCERV